MPPLLLLLLRMRRAVNKCLRGAAAEVEARSCSCSRTPQQVPEERTQHGIEPEDTGGIRQLAREKERVTKVLLDVNSSVARSEQYEVANCLGLFLCPFL